MANEMSNDINADNIIEYICKNVGPVPYRKLVANFCQKSGNAAKLAYAKGELDKILAASINKGTIAHFNNHFFAGTRFNDMENTPDLNRIKDISPNLGSNSLSRNSELFGEAIDSSYASVGEEDDEEYEFDENEVPLNSTSISSTQSTQVFKLPSHSSSFSVKRKASI